MAKSLENRKEFVLNFIKENPSSSSKEIHKGVNEKLGYAIIFKKKLMKEKFETVLIFR